MKCKLMEGIGIGIGMGMGIGNWKATHAVSFLQVWT